MTVETAPKISFRDLRDPLGLALNDVQADIDRGAHERAARRLQDLRQSFPGDGRVYLCAAKLAERLGNKSQWLACTEQACALMPGSALARLEFARALHLTGDNAEALAQADEAARLGPSSRATLLACYELAFAMEDRARASRFITAALTLAPEDLDLLRAAAWEAFLGRAPDQALTLAERGLAQAPSDEFLRSVRIDALFALDRDAEALPALEALVADFPDNERYRYMLAGKRGERLDTVPASMVESLFDRYAAEFDRALLAGLKYRAPELVASAIRARFPNLSCSVLDLGCGTGLLGRALGRPEGWLIGVDLSRKMLEEAARHALYDRLHHAELLEALSATASDHYEVIAACDVFVYIGELEAIAREAGRVLKPGGLFVFTCEQVAVDPAADGFALDQITQRYSHGSAYLERILGQASLISPVLMPVELRLEAGTPVRGVLVTATKPLD